MSRAVEAVVVGSAALPALATGVGAVALGVGAAAYGAYRLAQQLHEDYQTALDAFHAEGAEEECARADHAAQQAATEATALALAAHTRATAVTDAGMLFLQERVQALATRATSQANLDLSAQCLELQQQIAATPAELGVHLEAYRRLADMAAKRAEPDPAHMDITADLEALRADIMAPLLDAPECAGTRAQFLAQLDALQAVAARQRHVTRQGLTMLRRRIHRELQAQASRQQERARRAEEGRALVTDISARLQALTSLEEALPESAERARAALAHLGTVLAGDEAEQTMQLRALAAEATALFTTAEQALREQAVAAYIGDQVTDALYSLGYAVTQLSPEESTAQRTYFAPVNAAHGIEFYVDGQGRLATEMVALSDEAATADPTAQDAVCTVVDQVIDRLAERECVVRERYRNSLRADEQLRVVEPPSEETTHVIPAEAPHARTMEEP